MTAEYRIAVMEALQRCTPIAIYEDWAAPCRPAFASFSTRTSTQTEERRAWLTPKILDPRNHAGPVTIEMRPTAPGHVARIKELAREGILRRHQFHRVIDGFMAQTGCPQGTGTGGSGKKLKAEFNKEPHVRGTASMARAASPDSGDSQFFICFDDASFLNRPVHGVGQGHRGHGESRQDQARRAGQGSRQDRQGADGG
jgi:cyclophilin family peptidyl-prolyl cis-trans isomerase